MDFTYGLELEFVDADRRQINLPEGCKFNQKEVTLVNSDGVAVNSLKNSTNWRGGEINTCPTQSIGEQVKVAKNCLNLLKMAGATINYRCNTHPHVGLPPELQTVEVLQKIQAYAFKNFQPLILMTMGPGQFEKKPEYPVAFWSHYKERMVPQYKHDFLMAAKTLKEFQMAFFLSKDGKHAPMTFMRQLVNTHSFFKTKTIEYRGFWGSLDIDEIQNCLEFLDLLIDVALNSPNACLTDFWPKSKRLPKELPFDLRLEQGFQSTKVAKP